MLNNDVLRMICACLDRSSIQSLRLVNRQWEDTASLHLFPTIVVRPREDVLQNITRIAEHSVFARGVREVVWETGHYADYPSLPSLERLESAIAESEIDNVVDAFEELQTGTAKQQMKLEDDRVVEVLGKALKSFTGLRNATLACWAPDTDSSDW